MSRRGPRPVVFICGAIHPEKMKIESKQIQASSQEEAISLFFEMTGLKVEVIHGPLRPKRKQVLENTRELVFANEQKRTVYNGCEVNAIFLKKPENCALVIFLKRVDGQKTPLPKGNMVVPLSELTFDAEQSR